MSDELFRKAEEMLLQQIASDPGMSVRFIERTRYCLAHKIGYYDLYTMEQAALILTGTDDTTSVKRYKKDGLLAWVRHGKDGVRFFGYQLASFHLDNIVEPKWDGVERRSNFRSANGILPNAAGLNSGTAAASTPSPEPRFVSQLASGLTAKKA